ncbi:MAG: hypothetical protein K8I02_06890 [Candidatus Methylomirabilis sp.]|nr:hypothetical protein [Deltaproteobacteria bacterium]
MSAGKAATRPASELLAEVRGTMRDCREITGDVHIPRGEAEQIFRTLADLETRAERAEARKGRRHAERGA